MNTIQKVILFYFSGTGNAKRIALWFSEFAIKNRIDCEVVDIAKCDKNIPPIDDALVFIISPIHGFNYPKITLDFIRNFPKGNNRVVLMNTRAGMKIGNFVTPGLTGIAFFVSSCILRNKGYKIVGQIPFDMPSNWLSIHPALNEKTVKYLHRTNYTRVEKHAVNIFSGKPDFLAYRDVIQDILISPIAIAYYFIGRFILAKSFYATIDCDSCGLCIKQCPVQAINMFHKHPFWTFKCESCMRCMNNCPKRAIETAHGLLMLVSIVSSVVFTIVVERVLQLEIQSSCIRFTLSSVIFIAILWILYYIQHVLLKYRILSKIVSLASLTHYTCWGRYKSISDKKWKE
jgi:ferredoxin/flavodoxin